MPKFIDLTGQRFGLLLVIFRAENNKRGTRFLCRCDCGNKKIINSVDFREGRTKSCGCLKKKRDYLFGQLPKKIKHGMAKKNIKKPSIYSIWLGMRQRCENPKASSFHRYGGRGITVCERWHKIENFLEDMRPSYKEGLEIDRIDNDKGYSPDNCRWVTRCQNTRNTRFNHLITFNGETHCLSEWAEILGMNRDKLWGRIRHNWPIEKAFHQR